MTTEVSKQSAYVTLSRPDLPISKQSAYVTFNVPDLPVTKQTMYVTFYPYVPPPVSARRRMPYIVN